MSIKLVKTDTYGGHRIEVLVDLTKLEVVGLVDGTQVYGIYTDDPYNLRVSMATAPTGTFNHSQALVHCMTMVGKKAQAIKVKALTHAVEK